ncbi:large conductance mechanosensitive channel protein MscL [Paenibacillus sp. AR247]|uniref:large conductance mechanosensitive channel protein MscL n=1 Tax=Paenibacillus sp. AR247 TaxID=1631599 RepID=UPI000CF9C170|nr:large conductance mechanosensitive channel protein MscL [Paenibacillus sp. AR247]PQP86147.1 large conductance mechanosensitive channel protein MscL [Paenibacillus sp. AR247]
MKGFIHEFKEFAVRGNVIDLAVGVIIGGAFGKIVSSIVSDIIMPPIGVLLGGVDFADLIIRLDDSKVNTLAEAKEVGAPVIAYGQFLNTVIDFLIISFCIFLLVKGINWIKSREHEKPEPEKTTKECPYCLSEIPAAATRCAHCTSVLDTDPEPQQA